MNQKSRAKMLQEAIDNWIPNSGGIFWQSFGKKGIDMVLEYENGMKVIIRGTKILSSSKFVGQTIILRGLRARHKGLRGKWKKQKKTKQ